jgi:hypothetical protein
MPCPLKFYTLATYISNPKEETTIYLLWDSPKLDFFIVAMGQSKIPITTKKILNFDVPIMFSSSFKSGSQGHLESFPQLKCS